MGMGIGDWGLGIGDWAQSPIPNPQSPIPNPHFIYSIIIPKKYIIIFTLNYFYFLKCKGNFLINYYLFFYLSFY